MKTVSMTIAASFFMWPLLMLMAHLFGESASVGFHAIAVMWPLTLGLMLLDRKDNLRNTVIA